MGSIRLTGWDRSHLLRRMTHVSELVLRVERFVKRSGLSPKTVSRKVFLDSSRLKDLKKGSRMFPETVAECAKRLAKLEAELEREDAA